MVVGWANGVTPNGCFRCLWKHDTRLNRFIDWVIRSIHWLECEPNTVMCSHLSLVMTHFNNEVFLNIVNDHARKHSLYSPSTPMFAFVVLCLPKLLGGRGGVSHHLLVRCVSTTNVSFAVDPMKFIIVEPTKSFSRESHLSIGTGNSISWSTVHESSPSKIVNLTRDEPYEGSTQENTLVLSWRLGPIVVQLILPPTNNVPSNLGSYE